MHVTDYSKKFASKEYHNSYDDLYLKIKLNLTTVYDGGIGDMEYTLLDKCKPKTKDNMTYMKLCNQRIMDILQILRILIENNQTTEVLEMKCYLL